MASSLFGNTVMDEKLKCVSVKALWWSVKWSVTGLRSSYAAGFSPWETRMRIDREKRVCIEWVCWCGGKSTFWSMMMYTLMVCCANTKSLLYSGLQENEVAVCVLHVWVTWLCGHYSFSSAGIRLSAKEGNRKTTDALVPDLTLTRTELDHTEVSEKTEKNCTNVRSSWCVRSCRRDVFSCCFVK